MVGGAARHARAHRARVQGLDSRLLRAAAPRRRLHRAGANPPRHRRLPGAPAKRGPGHLDVPPRRPEVGGRAAGGRAGRRNPARAHPRLGRLQLDCRAPAASHGLRGIGRQSAPGRLQPALFPGPRQRTVLARHRGHRCRRPRLVRVRQHAAGGVVIARPRLFRARRRGRPQRHRVGAGVLFGRQLRAQKTLDGIRRSARPLDF